MTVVADARGLSGLSIYTTFLTLYFVLIAGNPKIAKGRHFENFGIGVRPLPQNVCRRERPICAEIFFLRGSSLKSVTRQFPRAYMPQIRWTKHGHQCLWLPDILLYH